MASDACSPAAPRNPYVTSTLAGVWELDAAGRTVFANEAMVAMLATTADDLAGESYTEFVIDHDAPSVRLRDRIRRGSASFEVRLRRRDGGVTFAAATTTPLRDEDGTLTGALSVVIDMTAQRVAEERLQQSERQLQALVANLPGVAYVCESDESYTMRYISDGVERVLGHRPADFLSGAVRFAELLHDDDRARIYREVDEAVALGVPFELEYRLRHADGSYRWILEHGTAVRGTALLEGVLLDVTDRMAAQHRLEESERRYRDLVEQSPDAIVLSRRGAIFYANAAACDLFGVDRHAVAGTDWLTFVDPADHDAALRAMRATERDGRDVPAREYGVRRADGTTLEVEASSVAVHFDGEAATETIIRDISTRRREERARAMLQGVFERIAAGAPLEETLSLIATVVVTRLPGRRCAISLVRDGELELVAAPDVPDALVAAMRAAPSTPCIVASQRGSLTVVDDIERGGSWGALGEAALEAGMRSIASMPIRVSSGSVAATVAVLAGAPGPLAAEDAAVLGELRDVIAVAIDHAETRAKLEQGALHDELTGLPNRRVLRTALATSLERTARASKVAVLFIDLDDFKLVNDSWGHAAGDQVLCSVAELLTGAVRDGDLVTRFSGDEFVICCEGISDPDEVEHIVERIHDALAVPFRAGSRSVRIHASIGIAVSKSRGDSIDRLVAAADAAMYRAKEQVGPSHAWFDEELRRGAVRRVGLEASLRRAFERDEIVVHYQPKVRLTDGTVTGAEALVRWSRGDELLLPGEFVPLVERSGLIEQVGGLVLRQACLDAAGWLEAHPGRSMDVAVNVSPAQLQAPTFAATVAGALADAGLPASSLTLELTETAVMRDLPTAVETLRDVKSLGVRLSIDDFGTGYSSLAYLKRFPIDELKIDRSFVADLGGAEDDAIVMAILGIATALGVGVVAEGVETTDQLDVLARLGCPVGQGWLWSPAVSRDEFQALVAASLASAPTLY